MWLNKKRFFIIAIILVIAAVGGLVAFRANQAQAQAEPPMIPARISEGMLESQYGMHVNLVAVTGAGGFGWAGLKARRVTLATQD